MDSFDTIPLLALAKGNGPHIGITSGPFMKANVGVIRLLIAQKMSHPGVQQILDSLTGVIGVYESLY